MEGITQKQQRHYTCSGIDKEGTTQKQQRYYTCSGIDMEGTTQRQQRQYTCSGIDNMEGTRIVASNVECIPDYPVHYSWSTNNPPYLISYILIFTNSSPCGVLT